MNVREAFPEAGKDETWFQRPDYSSVIAKLAEKVLVECSDHDYQGDTLALLESSDGRLGYLRFGWGSCSGCDALEACENYDSLQEVADDLEGQIVWFGSPADVLAWINAHDWDGSRDAEDATVAKFIAEVKAELEMRP